ncbi:MAG: ATPase P [Desulfuromonas sp.]|nr:ATPase P [Desulfuromonas sp.]
MLNIDIPGADSLQLHHLVLDYNGTLACDGQLLPELIAPLQQLADSLMIHVITADTHGSAAKQLAALPCRLEIIAQNDQIAAKQQFVHQLGTEHCVAIGNGYNDQQMLKDAALGIALIQREGGAVASLLNADIVCNHCCDALELLLKPARLIATLRR